MEILVANLLGPARPGKLHGRDHLIVPATLIVPGVLNGSRGPLLYPPEEVGSNPVAWNGVPILIRHPREGSGRTPEVFEAQGVGTVFNARFDSKLHADLWFDVERTRALSPHVYDGILNGRKLELSTGLKVKDDPTEGVHNTPLGPVSYRAIARNYQPDHLAILPDEVGACSLKDGCGVNNKKKDLSQDDIRSALGDLLLDKYGTPSGLQSPGSNPWVVDVFQNYLIFKREDLLFKTGYSVQGGEISLSEEEPVEVQRHTTYEPVTQNFNPSQPITKNSDVDGHAGSSLNFSKKEPVMAYTPEEKKTIIDDLISNSCCWEESDRPELESMTDNQLQRTKTAADKAAETENLREDAEKRLAETEKQLAVTNAAPVLSQEDRRALDYGREQMAREKRELIERLVSNLDGDARTRRIERLNKRDVEELREDVASMPAPPTANHYGPQPAGRVVTNKIDREDRLEIPDIDWTANSVFAKK